MKLQQSQQAPEFLANAITGDSIRLSDYRGKKIMLSFYRNAGCPVCNLRFHELRKYDKDFIAHDLVVFAFYQSSLENLNKYVGNENFHATIIANPWFDIYEKYGIERSTLKLLYSVFKGVMSKIRAGRKLYKDKIENDGHANLLGADFLIDEQGEIVRAYYNQYIGDHLPVLEILDFIDEIVPAK